MTTPAPGTVTWFQIGTDDPTAAKSFYGDLFGWTYATDPSTGGAYDLVTGPGADRPSGGIFDTAATTPQHSIFMVLVADVAATLAAAEALGGKVLVPLTTAASGLVFAHLADTTGTHFGVFTPPVA